MVAFRCLHLLSNDYFYYLTKPHILQWFIRLENAPLSDHSEEEKSLQYGNIGIVQGIEDKQRDNDYLLTGLLERKPNIEFELTARLSRKEKGQEMKWFSVPARYFTLLLVILRKS